MEPDGGRSICTEEGRWDGDELLRRTEPLVRSVAAHFAGDRVSAEELAQACRVRIYEKRGQCRSPDAVHGWAQTLCRRVCIDALRRERVERERLVEEGGAEGATVVDSSPDPLAVAARREMRLRIGCALDRIPVAQRRLLHLRHWVGLSASEIARRERLPASTVRNRLMRAHQRLRCTPELVGYAPRRSSLWS